MNLRKCGLAMLLLVALSGCPDMRGWPFNPTLAGHKFYLCCNVRFSPELRAADSNYERYLHDGSYTVEGPTLAAGTRVRVVNVGAAAVAIRTEHSETTYTLSFSYGRKQQTPEQYFKNILRATNPMDAMKEVPAYVASAIRTGQLAVGMTKEQTLIARGYPPAHQTPNLESNEWIYYATPGFVDRIVFADGKIHWMSRGPAPE